MVRPYSLDLRERVVAAANSGQSCRAVAALRVNRIDAPFGSSPVFAARSPSELRNRKGHWDHGLASVIEIEKLARSGS